MVAEGMRNLQVRQSGTYKVVSTDSNGTSTTKSVKVIIAENGTIYRIFTIGDSTVQDYTEGQYPKKGWGQVLQYFFDSSVVVNNRAVGGTSAKSFYDSFWSSVKSELQLGDYVFIQFGINDASDEAYRHTDPFTTFQDYLTNFVEESQNLGCHPVLVATLRRNAWNSTIPPTVYDSYHDYPIATRQLAASLNVPLIDLDEMCKPLMESLGPDYTERFWYMNLEPGEYQYYGAGSADDVHFQEMGAIEMAKLVVETIEDYTADTNLNKLIPHIKERDTVKVTTNFPDGGLFSHNIDLPAGITVTTKGIINEGYALNNWQDTAGNILTTENVYMFTMDTMPMIVFAELDDNPQFLDCTGKNYGTAYIDSCGECVGGSSGNFPCYLDFSDSTYKINPVHSGLCVEDNVTVQQIVCRNITDQLWTFEKSGSYYKIKNYGTERYIYVENTNSLTNLTTNSTGSEWRIEKESDSIFLLSPRGDVNMLANVVAGRTNTGERLLLWGRTSFDDQKYYITKHGIIDCNNDEYGTAEIDVCGTCSGGNTGLIPVSNELDCPLGIENIEDELNYSIQPNPTYDCFTIKIQNDKNIPYTLIVTNIQGQNVLTIREKIGDKLEFGSELKPGIYSAQIVEKNEVHHFKVVKK